MNAKMEFTIGAVRATEEIGTRINPKIEFFQIKNNKVKGKIDLVDQYLNGLQKANKTLKTFIPKIKKYSLEEAKNSLVGLYQYELLIESLLEVAKETKPESKKEKIFLTEFKEFGELFFSVIGLTEIMTLSSLEKKRIFSKNKKPSKGSRELRPEDLLD